MSWSWYHSGPLHTHWGCHGMQGSGHMICYHGSRKKMGKITRRIPLLWIFSSKEYFNFYFLFKTLRCLRSTLILSQISFLYPDSTFRWAVAKHHLPLYAYVLGFFHFSFLFFSTCVIFGGWFCFVRIPRLVQRYSRAEYSSLDNYGISTQKYNAAFICPRIQTCPKGVSLNQNTGAQPLRGWHNLGICIRGANMNIYTPSSFSSTEHMHALLPGLCDVIVWREKCGHTPTFFC